MPYYKSIQIYRGEKGNEFSFTIKNSCSFIESAQASLKQFALNTQKQQAKTTFTNAAQQTQNIIEKIL
jgi:hypothetical protein